MTDTPCCSLFPLWFLFGGFGDSRLGKEGEKFKGFTNHSCLQSIKGGIFLHLDTTKATTHSLFFFFFTKSTPNTNAHTHTQLPDFFLNRQPLYRECSELREGNLSFIEGGFCAMIFNQLYSYEYQHTSVGCIVDSIPLEISQIDVTASPGFARNQ